MTIFLRFISLLFVVALAACGGGSGTGSAFGGDAGSGGGGGTPPPPPVSNLSLNLSAPSINNSGSETITATVVATNANNQTMSNAPVVLSVDNGAEIAVAGDATDANGRLTATIRIGDNRDNRTVNVTATANNGSLVKTKSFAVVGARLTGTPVPATLSPSSTGVVKYRLLDSNSNPMVGNQIANTGPGGVQTVGVTGNNGEFDYEYTAPNAPGALTLTASGGGYDLDLTVLVQAPGNNSIPPVDPAANAVLSSSISANPSVVPVNVVGSTANQSQLRALFLKGSNAPVKNIRVRFDLAGDANSIGGTIGTGSTIVYSDAAGVATSSYAAGTRASPTDGVTVRACWGYNDAELAGGACPRSVTATLTVVADPVSVSIGTNALIEDGPANLTYIKRYVVQVVDSSGVAKPDVQITPSIDLIQYRKGFWSIPLGGDSWVKTENAACDNEDLNRNNASERYANGFVEDINGSFNLTPGRPALEPRKADVAISIEGSSRTNSSGAVVLKIEYPKNIASWVYFNILVSASGVSATEGRANFEGLLPVPGPILKDLDNDVPFRFSPYGVQGSPLVVVTSPGGDTPPIPLPAGQKTATLCTNPN
jgi:hypothetical protein